MADAEIKVKISKDPSSDLEHALKKAEKAADDLKDHLVDSVGGGDVQKAFDFVAKALTGPVGLSIAAVVVAAEGIKLALDFTLQSERIQQVSNSFDSLAQSAGISGQELKDGLEKSAHGLATTTELLEAGNRAIVQLGENAVRIPESMEIARKATALFGGDLIGNFEKFNTAIAFGNQRMLRFFGLRVNAKQAEENFARSLGVSADALTEAGKKQAFQNEALDQAKDKFKNVDESVAAATISQKQLGVALKELGENIAVTISKSSAFKAIFEGLSSGVNKFGEFLKNSFGVGVKTAADRVEYLTNKIKELEGTNLAFRHPEGIEKLRKELEFAKIEAEDALKSARLLTNLPKPEKQELFDPKKAEEAALKAATALQGMRNSLLASQESYYAQLQDSSEKTVNLDQIAAQKKLNIEADYQLKLRALKSNADLNPQQQAQAAGLLEAEKAAKIESVQSESAKRQLANSKQLNDGLKSQLVSGISSSIQGFTSALIKGQNAFTAFTSAIFKMFGEMAIKTGEFYVAQGIAALAFKGVEPTGTIAGGAALIALGTILSSFGSSSSDSSSSGGSVGASPATSAGTTAASPSVAAQPAGPNIHVNVQGSIFDSKQTGLRIADIIRDISSSNATVIAS